MLSTIAIAALELIEKEIIKNLPEIETAMVSQIKDLAITLVEWINKKEGVANPLELIAEKAS